MVEEGRRFAVGDTSDELLDGFVVRLDAVAPAYRTKLLTFADWAAQRSPFEALQLVLPDTAGRWPEDPAYNAFAPPALA